MTISIALEKEVYYAGETIIGKVELTQKESVKINNNVTIRIHGYAEVFGSMGSTGSRTDYLNKSSVLVVRSWKEALYSGNFSIPFHFDLPSTLPSTFNHPNCKIIYFLDLKYDEVAEIKPKVEKQVVVINKVDLNMEYGLRSPFTQKSTMKQPFEYSLTTNRRAYLSGDVIQVKASITNNSDVDLDHVPICLIESVSLWTKRGTFEINRVVACASFPARVRKRETESGRMRIRVPAVWPSSNDRCNIIDCTYYLAVVTKPADVANKPLDKPLPISQNAFDGESRIPILIGTVAYKEDTMAPPPYAETNQNGDELPMYAEVEAAENASLNGVTVELDSKRLTLPAIVPDLNKAGWSIGGLFGSVLRVCRD